VAPAGQIPSAWWSTNGVTPVTVFVHPRTDTRRDRADLGSNYP
jgi:hypothetical protein